MVRDVVCTFTHVLSNILIIDHGQIQTPFHINVILQHTPAIATSPTLLPWYRWQTMEYVLILFYFCFLQSITFSVLINLVLQESYLWIFKISRLVVVWSWNNGKGVVLVKNSIRLLQQRRRESHDVKIRHKFCCYDFYSFTLVLLLFL